MYHTIRLYKIKMRKCASSLKVSSMCNTMSRNSRYRQAGALLVQRASKHATSNAADSATIPLYEPRWGCWCWSWVDSWDAISQPACCFRAVAVAKLRLVRPPPEVNDRGVVLRAWGLTTYPLSILSWPTRQCSTNSPQWPMPDYECFYFISQSISVPLPYTCNKYFCF